MKSTPQSAKDCASVASNPYVPGYPAHVLVP